MELRLLRGDGVLAAEVLAAEGWAKLQRGQGGCRLSPV